MFLQLFQTSSCHVKVETDFKSYYDNSHLMWLFHGLYYVSGDAMPVSFEDREMGGGV